MMYREVVAACVQERIMQAFSIKIDGLQESVEIPSDPTMGDYALPCFRMAKQLRMAPPAIAAKLMEGMPLPEGFARVENIGGYLNFYVDRVQYAKDILTSIQGKGAKLGTSDQGNGKTICLDYSSINIAKRFHIGHLSTTMIGHSLKRIYEHLGYTCVGINHLGDWGTQFGKMIAAYKLWGDKDTVEQGGVDALTQLYVRFHEEAEKDPTLEDLGREWFKKIEDGDQEAMSIFEWFKEITLKDASKVYELLGVKFDSYAGESFYNDKMDRVLYELRAKNLLVESQGAYVVDLEDQGMPPCLLLKKDGATLYATRDLAAALYRKDTYDFEKSLYVVAYQQDLHFRQLFAVLSKMGYTWANDLEHVAFGMVSFEGQALSTRKGHSIYLDDLLQQSVEKALAIVKEKSPNLPNKEEVARQVGVGAVVFFDLYNNRIKDIDFWFDRVLAYEGETGPYVQYTHARCCSVLAKAEGNDALPDWSALADDEAQAVIHAIAKIDEVIAEAADRKEPSMISRLCVTIAKAYNHYYFEHRILGDDEQGTAARLALSRAVKQALATCLYLIGIEAPEKM